MITMQSKYLILIIALLFALVGSVSAYTITYHGYYGFVSFGGDGTGVLTSGEYSIPFTWHQVDDATNLFIVNPVFPYSFVVPEISFVTNPDGTFHIPEYPDAVVKL